MEISKSLLKFIRSWEGISLARYKDPAGLDTIGVGHLVINPTDKILEEITGKETQFIGTISLSQSTELLRHDVERTTAGMLDLIDPILEPNQYDALISLVFNIGVGNFKSSTLLRHLNEGNFKLAADQFPVWKYADKKVLRGLYLRRLSERCIFLNTTKIPYSLDTDEEGRIVDIVANYFIRLNKSRL